MSRTEKREREWLTAGHASRARYDVDAAPIIEELRAAGLEIDSVSDLYNKKIDYRSGIPILVAWLSRISNPVVKEDVVRALSVKWARHAAPLLITEFERADDPTGTGLRWVIGNALEALANDEVADGMIKLATNRSYGRAREMIVAGLGKLQDPRIPSVLIDLLTDDQVVGYALMAFGKLKTEAARPHIESLLGHPKSWVRKEAKKALASIDKAHKII